MSVSKFNQGLLDFLQASPTAFHAVASLRALLEKAGYEELREGDSWSLDRNACYFVVRNDSAIIAFKTGREALLDHGIRIAGAHTDSPCLKIKPNPEIRQQGYLQLGVEVYGGALFTPWFDRDLSIAGRINYKDRKGAIGSALLDVKDAIAVIPSLAIHLNRTVHENRTLNPQKELQPVVLQLGDKQRFDFDAYLLSILRKQAQHRAAQKILAHELYLYDTQAPAVIGMEGQFIASARLDNLLSCYVACQSLIKSKSQHASMLVCNDHEEVGSASTSGAQGPFLKSVLQRLVAASKLNEAARSAGEDASEDLHRMSSRSSFLSIDNAHGVHPNYLEKHDDKHRPVLNGGPVIKINANQRYASNSESVALFKSICDDAKVPYQQFVMRNDMACGSTIGPITATETGISSLDIGVATFGMHSIREMAGSDDPASLAKVVTRYFSR